MEAKKPFNKKQFAVFVIRQFKGLSNPARREECYKKLLEMAEKDPYSEEQKAILKGCVNLFRDFSSEDNNNPNDILNSHLEYIFDDCKRQYNMSEMYNPDLIAEVTTENGNKTKAVMFKKYEHPSFNYYTLNDNKFHLRPVGSLKYINAVGLRNSITKYQIIKEVPNGRMKKYEIYTNIIIPLLDESEAYKEAVLGELLSDKNIEFSNAKGYVGEVLPKNDESINLDVGDEEFNIDYSYKISRNYLLKYSQEDLSAVVSYESEKENLDKENNDLEGEER